MRAIVRKRVTRPINLESVSEWLNTGQLPKTERKKARRCLIVISGAMLAEAREDRELGGRS